MTDNSPRSMTLIPSWEHCQNPSINYFINVFTLAPCEQLLLSLKRISLFWSSLYVVRLSFFSSNRGSCLIYLRILGNTRKILHVVKLPWILSNENYFPGTFRPIIFTYLIQHIWGQLLKCWNRFYKQKIESKTLQQVLIMIIFDIPAFVLYKVHMYFLEYGYFLSTLCELRA